VTCASSVYVPAAGGSFDSFAGSVGFPFWFHGVSLACSTWLTASTPRPSVWPAPCLTSTPPPPPPTPPMPNEKSSPHHHGRGCGPKLNGSFSEPGGRNPASLRRSV
jgi:hypothetical protein